MSRLVLIVSGLLVTGGCTAYYLQVISPHERSSALKALYEIDLMPWQPDESQVFMQWSKSVSDKLAVAHIAELTLKDENLAGDLDKLYRLRSSSRALEDTETLSLARKLDSMTRDDPRRPEVWKEFMQANKKWEEEQDASMKSITDASALRSKLIKELK